MRFCRARESGGIAAALHNALRMLGSAIVYLGLLVAFAGFVLTLRKRGPKTLLAGLLIVLVGFFLPAPESHVERASTHLDGLMPRWQFSERHSAHVAASPDRVFAAIHAVRADEIALFNLLTWIRRGGRSAPANILNAGNTYPLLDVATGSGFIYLADDPPHEVVVGTAVIRPPNTTRRPLTLPVFRMQLPPGYALAAMNFHVLPDGKGGSLVTTETRVYANDDSSRRAFARYWRVIYPGSSLIRFMWLRAIAKRAEL